MSVGFITSSAWGGSIQSTCRACGATHTHPNYSVHKAWRTAHQLECTPTDPKDAD